MMQWEVLTFLISTVGPAYKDLYKMVFHQKSQDEGLATELRVGYQKV
jgi:hypothetical protein